MEHIRRRAWTTIAVASAVYWGWLTVAGAVFAEDEPADPVLLALAMLPLAAAASVTVLAGLTGACDVARRAERLPLRLAAVAGLLELVVVILGYVVDVRGSEARPYGPFVAFAILLLPIAGVWGASARRFSRAPEAVREPVHLRMRRGWREATRSWAIIASHSSLLVLPVTSLVLGLATWFGGFVLAGAVVERTMPRIAAASFIALLPGTLVSTYLGAAYLAALDQRLRGHRATARDGLRVAWRRRRAIAGWSLLAAGVGAILQGLQQLRSEWAVAPLFALLAGIAWSLLTLFVLPVLALEERGVRDSIRRAGELVRTRWGEGMAGAGNLVLVGVAVVVPLSIVWGVAIGFAAADRETFTAVAVAGFVAFVAELAAIGTATQVLSLALYRHAIGAGSTGAFTKDDLDHALVPRRRLRRRS